MAEPPESQPAAVQEENAFFTTIRQPRIVLLLLAAWDIVGAVAEFFTSSGLFVDLRDQEIDGLLGGRALSWEAIPMAAVYLYASRDPDRYHRVFWLALIEQAAAIVANIYHLGAGDFSVESIIVPVGVAGGLAFLVFLHLFQPKAAQAAAD